MIIKRICGWCGRSMGYKEGNYSSNTSIKEPITHGICIECKEKALAEVRSTSVKEIKHNK